MTPPGSPPRAGSTRSRPTCGAAFRGLTRAATPLVLALAAGLLTATPATTSYADAGPRTWRVGPDRELTTPSAAAAVARDGDTVLIDPGTYSGDVATWTQDTSPCAGTAVGRTCGPTARMPRARRSG